MTVPSRGRRPNREKCIPCSGGTTHISPVARQVKIGNIDRYNGFNNLEEFIQVYQTIIEAAGGDDWVNANFLGLAMGHVHWDLSRHI
jgi:hypothetical protein